MQTQRIVKKYTDKTFDELSNSLENADLLKTILIECNNELRDTLATLTFEIWEDRANKFGVESRKDLPNDYWESFVSFLTGEWPGYKMSDNVEQRYHSKEEIEQEQIESDLANIHPTKQNGFLFNKRLRG